MDEGERLKMRNLKPEIETAASAVDGAGMLTLRVRGAVLRVPSTRLLGLLVLEADYVPSLQSIHI